MTRPLPLKVELESVQKVLTRTSGYLGGVSSHSLQPYRGCPLGRSLCGVGCYVRHNRFVTRGREWGTFLEVRTNSAESYLRSYETERRWARRTFGEFSIFLSSSTEPFPPQEARYGVTRELLEAMLVLPPDLLIVQTHLPRVATFRELLEELQERCRLRVHISVETDRDRLPGLPGPASSVERRLEAAATLRAAGIPTVITVSPLLPIDDPHGFFSRVAECADACVIDHFIEGDGSRQGQRTRRTPLPGAMEAIDARSVDLEYRDAMVAVARLHLPGRVGVSVTGFAGHYS